MASKYYDVVISGAGMVGAAITCALAKSPRMVNKRILLLEASSLKSSHEPFGEKYSNRVSALTPSTKEFMQNVGAWDTISKKRYKNVKKMQIWDACSDSGITFNWDNNTENVAYIVENKLIRDAFLEEIAKLKDRVDIQDSSRVTEYEVPTADKSSDLVKLRLAKGQTYETKLLIGADGFKSSVREAMNINYINWSYKQMSVVATLHLSEETENDVAWQRFLPDSTIALLPLSNSRSSLVWSTSLVHAKELLSMDESSFVRAVNAALWDDTNKNRNIEPVLRIFSEMLNTVIPVGPSARQLPPNICGMDSNSCNGFLLGFGHASNYVSPRVALVGDAAHRVHPHAGLGVNLGFGDVQCLTKTIEDAIYSGSDIGSIFQLAQYEAERQTAVLPLLISIDGLHRLFKTDFPPIVATRSIGVQLLNYLQPVKRLLMKQAMR